MKGKRKPNGHQEKRGKQALRRTIKNRDMEHPNYEKEFGHVEGDTIVDNRGYHFGRKTKQMYYCS